MSPPLHEPTAPPLPGAKTEVKTTTCDMGAYRCGIHVQLRDRCACPEVRNIAGNLEHALNKGVALFTSRDQINALTGVLARQFSTPNDAAHGACCSVSLTAGTVCLIGGSFWEFGGPDHERTEVLSMIGTAENHHSHPIRTGHAAIADEWIPFARVRVTTVSSGPVGAAQHATGGRALPQAVQ
jgi:hypothetical protein